MIQGIKNKDIKDFNQAILKLNNIINRIREYNNNAILYVTPNTIHLLSNTSSETDESEFIVASCNIDYMDCGDW